MCKLFDLTFSFVYLQVQLRMASSILDSSVPLVTLFTNYSEWKMKMIASLKRQDLYEVSTGLGEESFERKDHWLNKCDAAYGNIYMAISPSMFYLKRSVRNPKDLWKILDRTFRMIDEDHNNTLESTSSTISISDPKILASTLSDEVVQDEEEAEAFYTVNLNLRHSLCSDSFSRCFGSS